MTFTTLARSRRALRTALAVCLLGATSASRALAVQDSPHHMNSYGLLRPAVADAQVRRATHSYVDASGARRTLHLYTPRETDERAPLPVVLMAAATRQGSLLERAQYVTWARALTSSGLAAVVYDSAWESEQSLTHVLRTLRERGARWGLDPLRVGAFAASGNVWGHARELFDADNDLGAIAFYYGAPEAGLLAEGVPCLVASAGLDGVELNTRIAEFVSASNLAGGDVEWLVHHDGHHAFDILDDTPRTHAIVERTLAFFRERLLPRAEPAALDPERRHARDALAHAESGAWDAAARAYAAHLEAHPEDVTGWIRLANAEIQREDFAAAGAAFDRLVELDEQTADAAYNAACMYALAGRLDEAFARLERARAAGFHDADALRGDPDLAALRDDPRFAPLVTDSDDES